MIRKLYLRLSCGKGGRRISVSGSGRKNLEKGGEREGEGDGSGVSMGL